MFEKINLRKKASFLIIQACLFTSVYADDLKNNGTWSNQFSFSEETIEDYLPEEEDSDRIKARRFSTNYIANEINPIPFSVGVKSTTRDYETRNLDNKSISFTTKIGKSIPERNKNPFTQNISLKYRRKRYNEQITNSFDQVGGKYTLYYPKKKNYKITGNIGIDKFNYTESGIKNEDRFLEKLSINKYFLNEELKLDLDYKHENLNRKETGLKKIKNEYGAGCRWRADKPWLYMIKVDGSMGYRNAKDNEDDDKGLDYKYDVARIRLDHRILDKTKVYNSAEHYKKEYTGNGQYDNEGFELEQGWKHTITKTKEKSAQFDINFLYKKFNYFILNQYDFEKSGINVKYRLKVNDTWNISNGLGYAHRNQRNNSKIGRDDYTIDGGIEKELKENNIVVSINAKYVNRNYSHIKEKNLFQIIIDIIWKV